jgi:hypothetical protein
MTWRQWKVWQEWMAEENNRPSRTDHYLMALRMEVRGLFAKATLDEMRLEWKAREQEKRKEEMTEAEQIEFARRVAAQWTGSLGVDQQDGV